MPEAVLNNLDAQMAAAAEMRRAKAGSPPSKGSIGGLNSSEQNEGGGSSFRERLMAARQAMDLKERAKEKIEEKILAPAKAGTNWLLRWAWGALIPSFGLTLIYINMHLFLRQIFPHAFCKLGEEWAPKLAQTGGKEIAKSFGGAGKIAGIIEIMGLLFLDLAVLMIVIIFLGLIVMIIDFITGGVWEKIEDIWTLTKTFTGLSWSGIKALIDLF